MNKLVLRLDFLNGPIWRDVFDAESGGLLSGITVVDKDEIIDGLNKEISEKYDSYYSFDTEDKACSFDEEAMAADKELLLSLMSKLNARLKEINDGSFEVEDLVTLMLLEL